MQGREAAEAIHGVSTAKRNFRARTPELISHDGGIQRPDTSSTCANTNVTPELGPTASKSQPGAKYEFAIPPRSAARIGPDEMRLSDIQEGFSCSAYGTRGAETRSDFPKVKMGAG